MAASTLGKVSPSWSATCVLAVGTKLLRASNIPTFPFHLAFSRISSRFLKINRVDSGGKSLIIALAAEVAAAPYHIAFIHVELVKHGERREKGRTSGRPEDCC
jgi:hypothetical protein